MNTSNEMTQCNESHSILAITVASELAASREDVKGTGTFLPALIDELYNLTPEKLVDMARIEVTG